MDPRVSFESLTRKPTNVSKLFSTRSEIAVTIDREAALRQSFSFLPQLQGQLHHSRDLQVELREPGECSLSAFAGP